MVDKRKQKIFERIRWKDLGKRLLVTGLTVAMIGNSVDLSALAVLAKADKGRTTVVSFEELSKDVTEQTLPLGASESEIQFPDSLTVTVERSAQGGMSGSADSADGAGNVNSAEAQGNSAPGSADEANDTDDVNTADAQSDTSGNANNEDNADGANAENAANDSTTAGTQGAIAETICLEDIKWVLDAEVSDAAAFDSSEASNGFCYAYVPVLPQTDGEGNQLVLSESAVLPTIHVLVGEYGIATLAGESISFTAQPTIAEGKEKVLQGYNSAPVLTVEVTGSEAEVTYQWCVKETLEGAAGEPKALEGNGANTPAYQIPTGLTAGTYEYYCEATCGEEVITSDSVTFTVVKGAVELTTENGETSTKHYETLGAALTALSESDASSATLKFLKDIDNETFNNQEVTSTTLERITIDLNDCQVGYKENSVWKADIENFGFTFGKGVVVLKDSGEGKTGHLYGTLQMNGADGFTMEGGTCENLIFLAPVKASLDGSCTEVEIGSSGASNESITCEVKGGTYNNTILVWSGATLNVSGDADIATLDVRHKVTARADVELSGGHYGTIQVTLDSENEDTDLNDTAKKFAIADMLAESYVFCDGDGELKEVGRTEKKATDLTVRPNTVDAANATVKIEVTKENSTTETTYYASWKAATDYLSDSSPANGEFETWRSVKIALLKDAKISTDVNDFAENLGNSCPSVIVCSENGKHTLTGGGSNEVLNAIWSTVTLENIKIEGGYIRVMNCILTLEKGVEVSSALDRDTISSKTKGTIVVNQSELVLNNASVTASTEGSYGVDLYKATLRMNGADTKLESAYISGTASWVKVTAVIDAFSAGNGSGVPVFTAINENAELDIYYTGSYAQFDSALESYDGIVRVWYPIDLQNGATLAEGKNAETVSTFEDGTYGLYRKNKDTGSFLIYVGEDSCQYTVRSREGGSYAFGNDSDKYLKMPAGKVEITTHKWDTDGSCSNTPCSKVNIERAYAGGALKIEGLEERTYDSYPQILASITWTPKNGEPVTLNAPIYQAVAWPQYNWKPLGVGGDPLNSNAEYAVLYRNNVVPYSYKQGEDGFNAAKAPQVTITGMGKYVGSLTVYFTIGEGKMRMGDFEVLGTTGDIPYDGKAHPAWTKSAVEFETDRWDGEQFTQYADEKYIPACDRTAAYSWFGTSEDSWENPLKIEYSTDDGVSWTTAKEFGREGDSETKYMITDAGEYPFYIRVTEKSCGVLTTEELVAKLTPKNLEGSDIIFDTSAGAVAYYTGKPVIPADFDDKITDNTLNYVLVKDKDFIVSGMDNTDVSDNATVVITGTGNYQGKLRAGFAIKYAFALAQTSISKSETQWYYDNPRYWKDGGVPVHFRVTDSPANGILTYPQWIVYRSENEAGLSDGQEVEFYTSLADAVAGTNPGYIVRGEGIQTVTLWGKDKATGYIAAPVEVTLKIDNTAPTWADKDGNEEGYGIQIKENWWRTFLNTVSFGLFYRDSTMDIIIKANDEKSGVDEVSGNLVYYCYIQKLSDEEVASGEVKVKTAEELDRLTSGARDIYSGFVAVSGASSGTGKITGKLAEDGNYIVYAYAIDNYGKGKRSDYICSEGFVIDSAVPELSIEAPDKENGTLKDTEATITVKDAKEDMTLLWFSVHEGEFASQEEYAAFVEAVNNYVTTNPYLPFAIYEDGKYRPGFSTEGEEVPVTGTAGETRAMHSMEIKKGDNELKITGLQASGQCTVWMAAIDRAGNIVQTSVEFTTTKAMPTIETLPEVSGVYGDTAADLKIAKEGTAVYGGAEIEGEWQVTDTGSTRLQAGDTVQCRVTFIPDAEAYGDQYENVVMYVPVTIAKRPITIRVENMSKTYGEPFPGVDGLTFEIVDMDTALAEGDTKDTIKSTLTLEIAEAAKEPTGIAGEWAFYVASDSENYEVTVEYYKTLSDLSTGKRFGTLVIEKAAGEILTTSEFKDVQDVTYRYDGDFATFSLGVYANHEEAALQYKVSDAKKADGEVIADGDIEKKLLSIAADGTVTLKGAGSATITVTLPESKNYESKELTVQVNIAKGNVTIPEFTRSVIYSSETTLLYPVISANGLNAERLGEITYGDGSGNTGAIGGMTITIGGSAVDYDGAKQAFFASLPYLANAGGSAAEIACTVKGQAVYESKTAVVTIPAETENCIINNGNGIVLRLEIVDQKTVAPRGEVTVTGTLTYGDPLSKLGFGSAVFYDTTDESIIVPGTLEWKEPDQKPDAGTYQAEYIFKPYSPTDPFWAQTYAQYTGVVTVTVNKAKARLVSVPVPGDCIYNPNLSLYEALLNEEAKTPGEVVDPDGNGVSGTWKFADETALRTIRKVGSGSYEIYFEPYDSPNLDCTDIRATVTITVKKAIPYIKAEPSVANAYTHGDYLYNQNPTGEAICGDGKGGPGVGSTDTLTKVDGTFAWKTPSTQLSYTENQGKTYEYIFTPGDLTSFEIVTGSVTVTVNRAQNPPLMPGSEMNVASICTVVGDVKLPTGWEWDASDPETPLVTGASVTATARYTGADAADYENTSVTVQITRADCEHAKTEVKGAVKATCSAEGYTGDIWCQVCQVKISSGSATAKDAGNHTALVNKVIKAATTTEEGILSNECTDCGYSETKSIAKLPTGGGTQPAAPTPAPATAPTPTPEPDVIETPAPVTTPAPTVKPVQPAQPEEDEQEPEDGAEMPFIQGEDGKEGWDVIKAEITVTEEGETIIVDMNGSGVVPGDVFEEIRGKDITIKFVLGNGISWYVNGKTVQTDNISDIDFRVTYGEDAADAIPVDIINALTGERYSMNVTLAYEGTFGFEAILCINVGADNKGLVANLFYYNESTGELEFISAGEVGEDGSTELAFTHASDYTIVLDVASMEKTPAADTTEPAGDTEPADTASSDGAATSGSGNMTALIWLLVVVGIVAAVVIVIVAAKKRKEEK